MSIIKLGLTDIGPYSVPIVYDSSRGTIQQDPTWVSTFAPTYSPNVYGPGDVFKAPGEGNRLVDYNEALAIGVSKAAPKAPSTQKQQVPGSSATKLSINQPASQPSTASQGTGAAVGKAAGDAAETTLDQLYKLLKRPIWQDDPKSVPTGVVIAGGVLLYFLMGRRRR